MDANPGHQLPLGLVCLSMKKRSVELLVVWLETRLLPFFQRSPRSKRLP